MLKLRYLESVTLLVLRKNFFSSKSALVQENSRWQNLSSKFDPKLVRHLCGEMGSSMVCANGKHKSLMIISIWTGYLPLTYYHPRFTKRGLHEFALIILPKWWLEAVKNCKW